MQTIQLEDFPSDELSDTMERVRNEAINIVRRRKVNQGQDSSTNGVLIARHLASDDIS